MIRLDGVHRMHDEAILSTYLKYMQTLHTCTGIQCRSV